MILMVQGKFSGWGTINNFVGFIKVNETGCAFSQLVDDYELVKPICLEGKCEVSVESKRCKGKLVVNLVSQLVGDH